MKQLCSFLIIASACFSLHAQVAPFLVTTWNQTCNYNADCPTVGSGGACGRAFTGCNATAMAQIFRYYSYPASGMGSHCNSNFPGDCVDFSIQTYNYAAMPASVSSANPDVAGLMYDLGVAVDMQWSGTSSNSFFSTEVFKRYFKYSPKMYGTATFMFASTEELVAAIKNELDHGRPVFAKGGNHFYLIDGYNLSDQFHMNFGWGGTYDNYYAITSVVNGAGTFTPGNFIFQIEPLQGDLETATDTIVVPAAASTVNTLEFTSLADWTISSQESWLSTALTGGTAGYYSFSDGSTFAVTTNNGPERYGHLLIDNGSDVDTVVVLQEASPLGVDPDSLYFTESAGNQSFDLTYYSWGSWSTTASQSWITLAPASGTGNASPVVSCDANPGAARNGFVTITAGTFTDTVWVFQEASVAGISENAYTTVKWFPNPAVTSIQWSGKNEGAALLEVFTIQGELVLNGEILPNAEISLEKIQNGIYLFVLTQEGVRSTERVIVRK